MDDAGGFRYTSHCVKGYAPVVGKTTPVREYNLGSHTAVLLGDIESSGGTKYLWILTVRDASGNPVLFLASEENRMATKEEKNSHYLGLFPGEGHVNFGASDDWADREIFASTAVEMAKHHLHLEGAPRIDQAELAKEQWYYSVGGERTGPCSGTQILGLLEDAKLSRRDHAWNPSMGQEWLPIAAITDWVAASEGYVPEDGRIIEGKMIIGNAHVGRGIG